MWEVLGKYHWATNFSVPVLSLLYKLESAESNNLLLG